MNCCHKRAIVLKAGHYSSRDKVVLWLD